MRQYKFTAKLHVELLHNQVERTLNLTFLSCHLHLLVFEKMVLLTEVELWGPDLFGSV